MAEAESQSPMQQSLTRQTRAFIVLVALCQGLLLYLADAGQEHGWWPFVLLGGRVCWYTLVLAVPGMMTLSVRSLSDRRFWQHAIGILILYALLAAWAAWSVTGAPGLDAAAVLAPFGVTVGGALFVLLPFLQCRLDHGTWRAPYPELFDHAWQNGLTLVLASLFTGICWLVLWLWSGLFSLVHVDFFHDLFFEQKPFAYLASGLFGGLGILIGRTQQHPLRVARQILFAVCRGLLPLLAFIAILFLISLPFTGLAPLWATRSAARLLLGLLLLLVTFVNAVRQDGTQGEPYPRALRWLIDIALLVSPVYAALALYALALRIHQYGWTDQRFWAVLAGVVLACHACGYAVTVARRRGEWLAWLPRVNVAVALIVVVLAVLANSPLLDPHRITVDSQIARLHAGRVAPGKLDLVYLRFESGRRGYEAVAALGSDPAMRADPVALAQARRILARRSRWMWMSEAQKKQVTVTTVAEARGLIQPAPGADAPDDAWLQALLAKRLQSSGCLERGSDCVLLTPDLRGDGQHENLLCNLGGEGFVTCQLSVIDADGKWRQAGFVTLAGVNNNSQTMQEALRAGKLQIKWPRWPDIQAGGASGSIETICDCDSRPGTPPPAATSSRH